VTKDVCNTLRVVHPISAIVDDPRAAVAAHDEPTRDAQVTSARDEDE